HKKTPPILSRTDSGAVVVPPSFTTDAARTSERWFFYHTAQYCLRSVALPLWPGNGGRPASLTESSVF
ncbi:MAG TPA: hypothetical protein VF099_06870, partial [Ktedonobacterales bacterium]